MIEQMDFKSLIFIWGSNKYDLFGGSPELKEGFSTKSMCIFMPVYMQAQETLLVSFPLNSHQTF